MKIVLLSHTLLAASLVFPHASTADIIVYDNNAGGASGIDNIFNSDSDPDSAGIAADDVLLSTTTMITGVQWTGLYALANTPPIFDDFTISFFGDDAGQPSGGAPLATFAVGDAVNRTDSGFDLILDPGPPILSADIYQYSAVIDFTMLANTSYWISIVNDTTSDTDDNYFWGLRSDGGNAHFSVDGGSNWFDLTDSRTDFRLTAVPEPSSLLLTGIGIAFSARRRRLQSGR